MLQDDIFKTCFAPTPALSADEWASGVDKDPILYEYTRDGLVELSPAACQVVSACAFLWAILTAFYFVLCQSCVCVCVWCGVVWCACACVCVWCVRACACVCVWCFVSYFNSILHVCCVVCLVDTHRTAIILPTISTQTIFNVGTMFL